MAILKSPVVDLSSHSSHLSRSNATRANQTLIEEKK
jgi:hypothetical protein